MTRGVINTPEREAFEGGRLDRVYEAHSFYPSYRGTTMSPILTARLLIMEGLIDSRMWADRRGSNKNAHNNFVDSDL